MESMEAIIRHSGRQFKVTEGATIDVDLLEVEPSSSITFSEVLFLGVPGEAPRIGNPTLSGATVTGKVMGTIKGKKLIAAQFRRRKNSRRRVGHRQKYTKVKIESIKA
jgi:large subunit ribosomal protein L21